LFPSPYFWFLLWFWSGLLRQGNHRDIAVILELEWAVFLFFGFGFVTFAVGLTNSVCFLLFHPDFWISFAIFGLFVPTAEPPRFCGDLELVWALFFGCGFGFVSLGWWVNGLLPFMHFSSPNSWLLLVIFLNSS